MHTLPSWNKIYESRHWRTRDKLVSENRELIGWQLKKLRIPTVKEKVDIHIVQFKVNNHDSDNIISKIWIDAMCDVGILEDDSRDYVGWVAVLAEKASKRKEEYTVVTITRHKTKLS